MTVELAKSTITDDVTDQIDGVTASFTVAGGPFVPGSLQVYHNGFRLREAADPLGDFVEAASFDGFTLNFVPVVDDALLVQFEIADSGVGFPLVIASGIDPTL